jgi:gliding motility-associated-like protein
LLFRSSLTYAQINASFEVNRSEGCIPLIVVFQNTSTGNPDSCLWDFGNGNTSSLFNPVATYTTSGDFVVTLTVIKGGQRSSFSKQIKVFPSPLPDFESDVRGGCLPLQVNFRDRSTATSASLVSWVWDFGDGRSSAQQNPVNTYRGESSYNVTLIVTDDKGCKGTITKNNFITTTSSPFVDFETGPTIACKLPFDLDFKDKSISTYPLQYTWSFGDGATTSEQNPRHSYQSSGVFQVRLSAVNQFGCGRDTTKTIQIELRPFIPQIALSTITGCAPLSVEYNVTGNMPVQNAIWAFGEGSTSNNIKGSFTYTQEGSFTVTAIVQNYLGCREQVSREVTILPRPAAAISASPTQACQPPLQVQFSSNTPEAVAHLWTFGDGTTSTEANPVKTYTQSRNYTVRYIAINAAECRDTVLLRDYIKIAPPILMLVPDNPKGCIPHRTDFILLKEGLGQYANIQWDFGNGQTFSGINPPPQTYSNQGIFNVTANITFSDNCPPATLSTTVSAGNKPTFSGTFNPKEVCVKKPGVNYTATGGDSLTVFTWFFGDGNSGQGRTVKYEYSEPGTFPVTLVGDNFGCKDSIFIDKVVVNPPMANFRVQNDCGGKTVIFRNTSIGNSTSLWDFGDGTILNSNTSTVIHNFPSFGSYQVKLIVTNEASGCVDSIIRTIELNNNRPSLTLSPTTGCVPLQVFYADTTRRFRTIIWDLGDRIVTGDRFSRTYNLPGRYPVNVYTIDQNGCRDTFRFPNLIKAVQFDADFSFNPPGGCAPVTIQFKDETQSSLSVIQSWYWDFAGAGNSTLRNPTYTFFNNDSMHVTLIVTDNVGCRDTISKVVPVLFPKADFTSDFNSICTDVAFKFKNLSEGVGLTYFWDFGDGVNTSTDFEPSNIYRSTGQYDVKLVVKDVNNCVDSIKKSSYVIVENFPYDFDAFPRTKSCPELLTNFTIFPSDITYKIAYWDFGNGNQSLDTSRFPTNIYAESGKFDVTLILEDYRGCKDTIVKKDYIEVKGPRASFTQEPDSGCVPLEVTFTADFSGSRVNFWDFGNGEGLFDSTLKKTIQYVYDEPGIRTPSLVLDDGLGCIVSLKGKPVKVSGVNALMQVDHPGICTNQEITFTDLSTFQEFAPITDITWYLGDGNISKEPAFSYTYTADSNTIYFAVLEVVSTFGCKDYDTFPIRVYSYPDVKAEGSPVICKGDQVVLSATGASNFIWTPTASLTLSNTANPLAQPLVSTWYKVTGYDTIACPSYDSVLVRVVDRFNGNAGPDTTICIGAAVQLYAETDIINSGEFEYTWNPPDFLDATNIPNPIANPDKDISYTVSIRNGNCEELILPVYIRVGEKPDVVAGEDQTIFKGQEATLSATANDNVTYQWYPDYKLSCTNCRFPKASPEKDTTYYVQVINEWGCKDIDSVSLRIIETCSGDNVYVPNTFTPNNDGLNDFFYVRGTELSNIKVFRIYNRWGELIFETQDIRKGWDGTHNGSPVNSGVYVYYLEALCLNGQSTLVKGNVTVLR